MYVIRGGGALSVAPCALACTMRSRQVCSCAIRVVLKAGMGDRCDVDCPLLVVVGGGGCVTECRRPLVTRHIG